MSVPDRLSLLRLSSGVRETLPTKWPRSTNMAPIATSKCCASDDRHKPLNTFVCLLACVFGIPQTVSTDDSSPAAVVSESLRSRVYDWATFTHDIYLTALFRGNRFKEIHQKKNSNLALKNICTRTLQIPTHNMGDLTQHTVTLSAATPLYT